MNIKIQKFGEYKFGNDFCGTPILKKKQLPKSLQWTSCTCSRGWHCSSDGTPKKELCEVRQMLLGICWCPTAVGTNPAPKGHLSVAVKQGHMD